MKQLNYFKQLRKELSSLDIRDFGKWFVKNQVLPLGDPNDAIKQFREDRGY